MQHNDFYKRYGIRFPSHLVTPNVMSVENFKFPRSSCYLHYNNVKLPFLPNSKEGITSNEKMLVFCKEEFYKPYGEFTPVNAEIKRFIAMAKAYDSSPLYTFRERDLKSTGNSRLLVLSSGTSIKGHRYRNVPLREINIWKSILRTTLDMGLGENALTNRKIYLNIDVTARKPTMKDLKRYLDSDNERKIQEVFNSYTALTILEIFKWINNKPSLFSGYSDDDMDNVNILFTNGDKVVLINMLTLFGWSDETEVGSVTSIFRPERLMKALLLMFVKLNTAKTTVIDMHKDMMDTVGDEIVDLPSEKDLDKMMEEEVVSELPDDREGKEAEDTKSITIYDNKDILTGAVDITTDGLDNLDRLVVIGTITEKEKAKHVKLLEAQDRLVKEVKIEVSDLVMDESEYILPDIDVVEDKSFLRDTTGARDKAYIERIFKKDLANSFLSLNHMGIAIKSLSFDEVEKVGGGVMTITAVVKPIQGPESTITIKLPSFDSDGTYRIADNTYRLRKQKVDKPIRKKGATTVLLNTFYGKLFINKAKYAKGNLSSYINKHIKSLKDNGGSFESIVSLGSTVYATSLPLPYSIISRKTRSFINDGFYYFFDYNNRETIVDSDEKLLATLEGKNYTLIGSSTSVKTYLVMDKTGMVFENTLGKLTEKEHMYDILELDMNKAPVEYSSVKIYSKELPIALLLSYYMGFTQLLKKFVKDAKVYDAGPRLVKNPDKYYIIFNDKVVEFDRKHELALIILAGMNEFKDILREFDMHEFDDKHTYPGLFSKLSIPNNYIDELDLLEKMFVDPVTETVLRQMEEPTNLKGLLVRSSELLLTDYTEHPNNMDEMMVRGYDRVVGMMYTELIASLRVYASATRYGDTKVKFGSEIGHFSTWNHLGNDSGSVIVDDINPIAALKQSEAVSRTGMFGMVKEAITAPVREAHVSEIGVTGGATPASGEAGATMYLSAAPNITDIRGATDKSGGVTNGTVFATSYLLLPKTLHDDGKRANFVQVQLGHLIPMVNAVCNPVRTGYETVLAYRVNKKYAVVAKVAYTVVNKTKSKIVVLNSVTKQEEVYKLSKWHTKDVSGVSFTMYMKTFFDKGDTIKIGEGIIYNTSYFEPDLLDPKRLVFKTGKVARVSFIENKEVFEDSCSMHIDLTRAGASSNTAVVSIWLKEDQAIVDLVNIGDTVSPSQTLAAIVPNLGDVENMSKETLELLKQSNRKTPKSKYNGTVVDIRAFYNASVEDMNNTIKPIVTECDKRLATERSDSGINGKVGKEFSSGGKKLYDGDVLLQIYIEVPNTLETADKIVLAGQLKATVGNIYYETITNAAGQPIELQFSYKSVGNRIVSSVLDNGSTLALSQHYTDAALAIYNG